MEVDVDWGSPLTGLWKQTWTYQSNQHEPVIPAKLLNQCRPCVQPGAHENDSYPREGPSHHVDGRSIAFYHGQVVGRSRGQPDLDPIGGLSW